MFRKGDQDRKILEEAKRKLDELASATSEKFGLPVSVRIEKGKVYQRILRVAEEISARFIIMGKNDADEGFKRFIGTNTNHVISNANCPVITIKGKEHNLGVKNIVLPLDLTKKTREKCLMLCRSGCISIRQYGWFQSLRAASALCAAASMQK
jgi:hypothetical protein